MTRIQSSPARYRNSRSSSVAAESSEMPAGLLALGFLALICGTVAGFESTMRMPNAGDYGYAEGQRSGLGKQPNVRECCESPPAPGTAATRLWSDRNVEC